jgi:dTDP-4-dehydrorhamnose reductase
MLNKLLIIGADSNIGSLLYYNFHKYIKVITTTKRLETVNINNFYLNLNEPFDKWIIPDFNFDTAIICTAITSIKFCEDNPIFSYNINYLATIHLINILQKRGIFVIFPSSNLVYEDGCSLESNLVNLKPNTNYGKHKLLVENYISNYCSNCCILRLSKVLFGDSLIFYKWISDLKNNKEIYPFSDLLLSPISENIIFDCFNKMQNFKPKGIIELSASYDISYEDAALYIADYFNFDKNLIKTINYNSTLITSNKKTSMNCFRLINELNITPIDPYLALDYYLNNISL